MAERKRDYKVKDVDMVLTAATVIENAIANKAWLQSKREIWADPYFDTIMDQINAAIRAHLNEEDVAALRKANQQMTDILPGAIETVTAAKSQFNKQYKDNPVRKKDLLKQLGFKTYLKNIIGKNQKALVCFLHQFTTQLTPELKSELMADGITVEILDQICTLAESLADHSMMKNAPLGMPETSMEALRDFNTIYNKAVHITRTIQKFYSSEQENKTAAETKTTSRKPRKRIVPEANKLSR